MNRQDIKTSFQFGDPMQHPAGSITLTDFLDWEESQLDKHELIDGRVLAFSGGSFDHEDIIGNLYVLLTQRLPTNCRVYSSNIIIQTAARKKDSGPRADLVTSCHASDSGKGRYLQHPRIVVEVRSPSNQGSEWEQKLFDYRDTLSIEQLIIVESEARAVTSYARDETFKWLPALTTIRAGDVEFVPVEIKVTLDEIYQRTSLDI